MLIFRQRSKFPRDDHAAPDLHEVVAKQSQNPVIFDPEILKTVNDLLIYLLF